MLEAAFQVHVSGFAGMLTPERSRDAATLPPKLIANFTAEGPIRGAAFPPS